VGATQAQGFSESFAGARPREIVHTYGMKSSEHEKKPKHKYFERTSGLPKDAILVPDFE
jgi:hypothetical protein